MTHISSATTVILENLIKKSYRRNRNSRSKTKNLRCFPVCSLGGHVNNGFCGQAVNVILPLTEESAEKVYAVAQFEQEHNEEPLLGQVPPAKDVRSRENLTGNWINVKTTRLEDGKYHLVVNPELLGWHYEWKGSKAARNIRHCLCLYIYRVNSSARLEFLKRARTEYFFLYSGTEKGEDEAALGSKEKRSLETYIDSPILSKTKVEKPKRKGEVDDIPIRELLQKVTAKIKNTIACANSYFDDATDEMNGSHSISEDANLELFNLIGDANHLLAEFDFKGIIEEVDDEKDNPREFQPSEAVSQQVVRTLVSDELAQELSQFFAECSEGPVGTALCEYLDGLEDIESNIFIIPFAQILFRRFQSIIAKRIELDLYHNGYISVCKLNENVRGSSNTTRELINKRDEKDELVYDPRDRKVLIRFLEKIQYIKRHKSLSVMIREKRDNHNYPAFSLINKTWELIDGQPCWFIDVLYKELKVMDISFAMLLNKITKTVSYYVTKDKVTSQGKKALGDTNMQVMIADGEMHEFDNVPPLFDFVEGPPMSYICSHDYKSSVHYSSRFCMWYLHPILEMFLYTYNEFYVSCGEPNYLYVKRKLLKSPEELDHTKLMRLCQQDKNPYICGKPAYEYIMQSVNEP